ncbi:tyrosine-type recombinase/integrase [Pseudofrancisella aestuarii]|uniref:Tyrosine-type recombinase/integrase n=1 Tax=Pseudofrancisella aestuarii TaxID=2670347 RepID=A0ABV9TBR5_9GAMM|nr:site-specific integrase [Pseudofrancisella aestuarii]
MGKLTKKEIDSIKHSGSIKSIERYKDINNLYLEVKPSNAKSWLYRYQFNGKPKSIGLGGYPNISLSQARELTNEYNKVKARGVDPKIQLQQSKYENTKEFQEVADKWLEKKQKEWSTATYKKSRGYLYNDILPIFKTRNINEIEYIEIANFLKRFKDTPTKQNKIKIVLSGIYQLAKAYGLCEVNHINSDLGIVMERQRAESYPFIHPIDDKENLSKLLNDIDNYHGNYIVKKALQLAPYLAFRPNMIVSLKWSDFREKEGLLVIEAENMKMRKEFKQPLSDQAFNILMELKEYTGTSEYIFSNRNGKHITPDSLRVAIQRGLGYIGKDKPKFTTHGWRHVTSTGLYNLQRKYRWQTEAIEMVLDHQERNKVKAVYNNYDYLDERKEILSVWASFIDDIKQNGNIIDFEKVS